MVIELQWTTQLTQGMSDEQLLSLAAASRCLAWLDKPPALLQWGPPSPGTVPQTCSFFPPLYTLSLSPQSVVSQDVIKFHDDATLRYILFSKLLFNLKYHLFIFLKYRFMMFCLLRTFFLQCKECLVELKATVRLPGGEGSAATQVELVSQKLKLTQSP